MNTLLSAHTASKQPTKQLRVTSPAKLNLFLHIVGKRSDGYHNLQTLFQLIDLADILRFSWQPTQSAHPNTCIDELVTLHIVNQRTITSQLADNLIIKAARLLFQYAKKHLPISQIKKLSSVHITLEKHIPMGAGLGGGSSNAASTLVTLNNIWQLGLSQNQLAHLGQKLGADVPVFIVGQNAWAEGIGEKLYPVKLKQQTYLILAPQCHVSTAALFSHSQLPRNTQKVNKADFLNVQPIAVPSLLQTGIFHNDFENLVVSLYPEIAEALQYLTNLNLGTARLTGSGACVFLPLPDQWQQHTTKKLTQQAPCPAYVCQGTHYTS